MYPPLIAVPISTPTAAVLVDIQQLLEHLQYNGGAIVLPVPVHVLQLVEGKWELLF